MAKARFLYSSFITAESMLAVSSLKLGIVTTALKTGTGSASITPSGDFSGSIDLEYVVEIDHAGTGEIGSSTFKWSEDGGENWTATDVATSATDITLSNGVKVKWTAGTGADFVLADKWYFKGINLYNPGKMLDYDRDSRFRSGGAVALTQITINLGATPPEVKALIIYGHNLIASAGITLESASDAGFSTDHVTETVVTGGACPLDKILYYLPTPKTPQYWRINITVADTSYAESEDVVLVDGWNTFTLSVQPADTAIATVLADIDDNVQIVWAYINGSWKNYDPADPEYSDLLTMVAGQEYHIFMTSGDTLTVTGTLMNNYVEIGELYLGSYLELSANHRYGEQIDTTFIEDANRTASGITRKQYYNTQEKFTLKYAGLTDADITALKAMLAAISNQATGQRKPLYFNHDSATPADNLLVDISPITRQNTFINQYTATIIISEVLKTI